MIESDLSHPSWQPHTKLSAHFHFSTSSGFVLFLLLITDSLLWNVTGGEFSLNFQTNFPEIHKSAQLHWDLRTQIPPQFNSVPDLRTVGSFWSCAQGTISALVTLPADWEERAEGPSHPFRQWLRVHQKHWACSQETQESSPKGTFIKEGEPSKQ